MNHSRNLGIVAGIAATVLGAHSASAATIFVDANAGGAGTGMNWTDAFVTLQDALADSMATDEIWVAAGTYTPDQGAGHTPGNSNETFQLLNNRAIYGGFAGGETMLSERDPVANVTTLSGDLGGTNSFRVVNGSGVTSTAILDGFTISDGIATGALFYGGGVFINNGSPTIENCSITNNTADVSGGGVAVRGASSSPTFINCSFFLNTADGDEDGGGGGVWADNGTPLFRNCLFDSNVSLISYSGGALIDGGTARFSGCTFLFHDVAIATRLGGSLTLVNCGFYENSSFGGLGSALQLEGGTIQVYGCAFQNNSGFFDTEVAVYTSRPTTMINCTLRYNDSGGIKHQGNTLTINNSILWENGGTAQSDQINQVSGTLNISYTTVQGWTGSFGGTANSAADPMFVDASSLELLSESPSIDSGDNTAVPADALDVDMDANTGEPLPYDITGDESRFVNDPATTDAGNGTPPIVDRGAYEFDPPVIIFVNDDATGADNGTSWTNAYVNLQDALDDAGAQGIPLESALR